MRRAVAVTFVALWLAGTAHAAGPALPPTPYRWVTDGVDFLSSGRRAALDAQLEAYQRQTGHQVLVWVGDTIGAAPLDDWAVKTFQAWKVGRKGIDDGLVVFVFASDRKVDIEVGYGLEDKVPDVVASRIIREVMSPRLRQNDHDGAVQAGVDALLAALEGEKPAGEPRHGPTGEPSGGPTISRPQLILFGLLAVGFLVLLVLNPRVAMLFLWSILGGGARGGGGGGGGGFSGGGFSGGGGRSGGGGARGSW